MRTCTGRGRRESQGVEVPGCGAKLLAKLLVASAELAGSAPTNHVEPTLSTRLGRPLRGRADRADWYQPEYSFVNLQRLKLRSVATPLFEAYRGSLALIYAVILFIDMTISKSNGVTLVESRQAGNFPADVMIANASLSDLLVAARSATSSTTST